MSQHDHAEHDSAREIAESFYGRDFVADHWVEGEGLVMEQRVIQIACGAAGDGGHMLYALTEDGRIWCQRGGTWLEEAPIPSRDRRFSRRGRGRS